MIKNVISRIFKKKTTEEKIAELTNKLIIELKTDGKSIGRPDISKGFGSLTIWVHNLENEKREIALESNGWRVAFKPSFTEFEDKIIQEVV